MIERVHIETGAQLLVAFKMAFDEQYMALHSGDAYEYTTDLAFKEVLKTIDTARIFDFESKTGITERTFLNVFSSCRQGDWSALQPKKKSKIANSFALFAGYAGGVEHFKRKIEGSEVKIDTQTCRKVLQSLKIEVMGGDEEEAIGTAEEPLAMSLGEDLSALLGRYRIFIGSLLYDDFNSVGLSDDEDYMELEIKEEQGRGVAYLVSKEKRKTTHVHHRYKSIVFKIYQRFAFVLIDYRGDQAFIIIEIGNKPSEKDLKYIPSLMAGVNSASEPFAAPALFVKQNDQLSDLSVVKYFFKQYRDKSLLRLISLADVMRFWMRKHEVSNRLLGLEGTWFLFAIETDKKQQQNIQTADNKRIFLQGKLEIQASNSIEGRMRMETPANIYDRNRVFLTETSHLIIEASHKQLHLYVVSYLGQLNKLSTIPVIKCTYTVTGSGRVGAGNLILVRNFLRKPDDSELRYDEMTVKNFEEGGQEHETMKKKLEEMDIQVEWSWLQNAIE